MTPFTIRPVRSKKDETRFLRFLWKIYGNNPAWVPPLMMDRRKLIDKKNNPFYQHAEMEMFLAERDGEVVGRIAGITNENHNKEHHDTIGFFGFFECIDDQDVANALFDEAKKFLRSKGKTAMRGPMNPSVNDEVGLLINAFDKPPVVMMTYNPEYYVKLYETHGLTKVKDLYAYLLDQGTVYSERFIRANDIIKERGGLTFRPIDMKHFNEDVDRIKVVYNKAWSRNWGAVPMTDAEFDALAKDLKMIVEPDLIILAEAKGEVIGFALALPDINMALKYNTNGGTLSGLFHLYTKKKKIDLVRVIVLGVIPEYQKSGASGVLFYETAVRAKKLGYKFGEASWVLEDNIMMNRAAEMMKGERYKTYRLYENAI
jgi:GNAT superfamily N-acetyltransferase